MGLEDYFPEDTEIMSYTEEKGLLPWDKKKEAVLKIGDERMGLEREPVFFNYDGVYLPSTDKTLKAIARRCHRSGTYYQYVKCKKIKLFGHTAYVEYWKYDTDYVGAICLFKKNGHIYALLYDEVNGSLGNNKAGKNTSVSDYDAFTEIIKKMQRQ